MRFRLPFPAKGISRELSLALLLLPLACGGGPTLSNLRCREAGCQHPESPFRLQLAVDFDDPSGTLASGALELRLEGNTQAAVSLRDLFRLQGLAPDELRGTLNFDQDVVLDKVTQNMEFRVSAIATNGDREESNEPQLKLRLRLGQ